ncbi:MAG: hypothetical protein IPG74_13415 [Flavobacteriales bacterium]|nr:hypothetical protein [Flavobacteriales bacterium]
MPTLGGAPADRLTKDNAQVVLLFRTRRGDELRKQYDTELIARQALFVIGILALMALTYAIVSGIVDSNKWVAVCVALGTEGVGAFLFSKFFMKPRLLRSYNEYVSGIEARIDEELVQGSISSKQRRRSEKMDWRLIGIATLTSPRLEPLGHHPARLFDRAAKCVEFGAGAELEQPVQVIIFRLRGGERDFVVGVSGRRCTCRSWWSSLDVLLASSGVYERMS